MNNNNFIGPFKNIAPLYIEYKRSLGFNSESEYNELKRLDKYFYNKGIINIENLKYTKLYNEDFSFINLNKFKTAHKVKFYILW